MVISKNEALSILRSSTADEVEEAYEHLLFEWKQKYLSIIPTVTLIESHIKKIERLNKAADHFLSFNEILDTTIDEIDFDLSLISYLESYQPLLMKLKLQISSADNGVSLVRLLNQLIILEKGMIDKLVMYNPNASDSNLAEVKISSPSDFHQVRKELIEKEISETEIKNYLRSELKFGCFPYDSSLLNEVLKAVKQKK